MQGGVGVGVIGRERCSGPRCRRSCLLFGQIKRLDRVRFARLPWDGECQRYRRQSAGWMAVLNRAEDAQGVAMKAFRALVLGMVLAAPFVLTLGCGGSSERSDTRQDTRVQERTEDRMERRRD